MIFWKHARNVNLKTLTARYNVGNKKITDIVIITCRDPALFSFSLKNNYSNGQGEPKRVQYEKSASHFYD